MARSGPRFKELSPPARAAAVVLGAIQIVLYAAAYRDISRRPAAQIRGSKAKWRAICLLNTVGPLCYFRWGRVKDATRAG
jgi:hypothetical protein